MNLQKSFPSGSLYNEFCAKHNVSKYSDLGNALDFNKLDIFHFVDEHNM